MDKNQNAPAVKPRYNGKGPIRTEAIVPFAIVVVLIALYFTIFFDGHLRRGLEWAATHGNGAEVDIGHLKTSFIKGSFEMGKIEVTDVNKPTQNKFEIGQVHFQFLWDALLRAKFVVEDASISGVDVATQRKYPGRVLPPPSPKDSLASKFVAQAKERVNSSALAGVGKILEGADPTQALGSLGQLKSVAHVNELKTDLGKKESEWQTNLAKIPSEKDFADLRNRINAISTGGGNPAEIAARVNSIKSLIQETNGKISAVQNMSGALSNDINGFQKSIGDIDSWVKADREELEKKLKIPSLDAKTLSEQLLGTSVLGKIQQAEHYVTLARQYMPPKKPKRQVAEKPLRAKGVTYEFPVTNSYPRFWLKKAAITSTGNLAGELLDVTTNQALIGRPSILKVQGDFPKKEIRNLELQITLDHRTETPSESMLASVGSYPVMDQMLSESEGLKFGLNHATGTAGVRAVAKGDTIDLLLSNSFANARYQVSAQSKLLESTIQNVLKELPRLDILAHVSGPWDHLDFSVESNLGKALEQGFGKQLQAKLAEARKKLDALIQAQVSKPKQELTSRFTDAKSRITGEIDKRTKQADGVKALAEAKLKAATTQGAAGGLEGLKKRLHF